MVATHLQPLLDDEECKTETNSHNYDTHSQIRQCPRNIRITALVARLTPSGFHWETTENNGVIATIGHAAPCLRRVNASAPRLLQPNTSLSKSIESLERSEFGKRRSRLAILVRSQLNLLCRLRISADP